MTTSIRILGLGLGAAVLAGGMAVALHASQDNTAAGRAPFMRRAGGPLRPLRMFASRLSLTDAQKQQMKDVVQAHREEWKALARRAMTARQALRQAISADTVDDAAIRQRSAELSAVQADIAVARARARAQIFQLLTPEQQGQAKSLRARMQERIGKMRKRISSQ